MKIEETLQLAVETACVGTWHLFVAEEKLTSSPKCKEIFGFPPEAEFGYDDFHSVLYPDDRALVEAAIADALDPKKGRVSMNRFELAELAETVVKLFQGRIVTSRVIVQPSFLLALSSLRLMGSCDRS